MDALSEAASQWKARHGEGYFRAQAEVAARMLTGFVAQDLLGQAEDTALATNELKQSGKFSFDWDSPIGLLCLVQVTHAVGSDSEDYQRALEVVPALLTRANEQLKVVMAKPGPSQASRSGCVVMLVLMIIVAASVIGAAAAAAV